PKSAAARARSIFGWRLRPRGWASGSGTPTKVCSRSIQSHSPLSSADPSHELMRFVHLDPPGLIRSREIAGKAAAACSGGLEDGPLDQNASGRILPERNQQLAPQ